MKRTQKPLNNGATANLKNYFFSQQEIIDQAYTKAKKVVLKRKFRNPILRKKALVSLKIKTFGDFVQTKLLDHSKLFPDIENMDPFYKDLLGAIVNVDKLKPNLARLSASSRVLKKIKSQYSKMIYNSKTPEQISKLHRSFEGRTCSVLKKLNSTLEELKADSKRLKEIPEINFKVPTMVLSGFPNVGKTTLLQRLTSSKAKISPYQFTTKQINLGYYEIKYQKIQIMDTPGLLDRKELNGIERKAVAAIEHLAKLIVFVIDPTLECGFPLEEQIKLLNHIKKQFPKTELLIVINKTDKATKTEIDLALKQTGKAILEGNKENGEKLKEAMEKTLLSST